MIEALKLFAFIFVGILGYLYAVLKIGQHSRKLISRVEREEQDDYREIKKGIDSDSVTELVRKSNKRLRKRRGLPPGTDDV